MRSCLALLPNTLVDHHMETLVEQPGGCQIKAYLHEREQLISPALIPLLLFSFLWPFYVVLSRKLLRLKGSLFVFYTYLYLIKAVKRSLTPADC